MLLHVAGAVAKAASTTATSIPAKLQTSDSSIFSPIAKPIADVLAGFYSVIPNFGVAILLLSLAWMIIIAPLTLKSTRSMLAMQKLQPQLKRLQAEHKNDRQAFAAAQMELFKEHNVSPFGSCLPTLLPLPVFFALFRVIDGLSHRVTYQGHIYAVPSFLSPHTQMYKAIAAAGGKINAFGLDLSKNALSGHSSFTAALPFYVLLLIMIGTQYLQTAQMMNRNKAAQDNPQMKFMKYLPIIFGVICIRFPAGVILYYAMSNVCRMAQQTAMYRYDPKVKKLVAQEVIEVEAITREIDRKGSRASKAAAETPAAKGSSFRNALNAAKEQAASNKAAKAGAAPPAKGARPATAKPTATTPRSKNGARPQARGADGANGNGQAAKSKSGASGNGQAARTTATTSPARTNGTNGNGAAKSPAASGNGGGGANAAGNGNGARTNSNGTNGNGTNGNGAPRTGRTGAAPTSRKRRGR